MASDEQVTHDESNPDASPQHHLLALNRLHGHTRIGCLYEGQNGDSSQIISVSSKQADPGMCRVE